MRQPYFYIFSTLKTKTKTKTKHKTYLEVEAPIRDKDEGVEPVKEVDMINPIHK